MVQTKLTETAEIGIQCDLLLPSIQIVSSSPSMQIIPIPSTRRNTISFVPVSMSQTLNSEPVQANDDPFASIVTPKYKSVGNPSMLYDLMQQQKSQSSHLDSTPTLSFNSDGKYTIYI